MRDRTEELGPLVDGHVVALATERQGSSEAADASANNRNIESAKRSRLRLGRVNHCDRL